METMTRPRAARLGTTTTRWTLLESPVGPLLLTADGGALIGIHFDGAGLVARAGEAWRRADDDALFAEAGRQLAEYFAGERRTFELPLEPRGTTFQQRVWTALRAVPYGQTLSYGAIARTLGDPKATRAVGLANGRNPLPIVIPCHRIIGADGGLTGFGGGLGRKRWLLTLEGALPAELAD